MPHDVRRLQFAGDGRGDELPLEEIEAVDLEVLEHVLKVADVPGGGKASVSIVSRKAHIVLAVAGGMLRPLGSVENAKMSLLCSSRNR